MGTLQSVDTVKSQGIFLKIADFVNITIRDFQTGYDLLLLLNRSRPLLEKQISNLAVRDFQTGFDLLLLLNRRRPLLEKQISNLAVPVCISLMIMKTKDEMK